MKHLRILTSFSTGLSAVIVAVLPILVAIDFGGVLWWTQYVAGLAVVAAFVLALPTLADWQRYFQPRQLLVIIPLLMWLMYSYFQTIPLPPSLVSVLSPGSYSAYTEWLQPILPAEKLPQSFPISIAQDDTTHAVALFGMMLVLTWTSLRVFNTRGRLIALLSCVAITGATVSILGIVGMMLPEIPFFSGYDRHFSTFVNRNNAALAMNLGLGASLGLLSWRLSALTGQEIDGQEFEFNDLYALTSDRDSAIGVLTALLCITGLLICGSRAGLATVLFATLLSLGWIRKRRGFSAIPVVLIATTILAALLTVPLKLDLESIKRLKFFSDQSQTILNDGRFEHWPEGWQTAMNHLPSGSGLSTYQYAYLPNQNAVEKAWFVHADNLWLELLVEQGMLGLSFAIFLLGVLVWCLQRMLRSHDALDHGLRVTGWYSLGAILFSQFFDFGFVVLANLLLAIPLMASIVTRSIESDLIRPGESTETESRRAAFLASDAFNLTHIGLQYACLLIVSITTFLGVGRLKNDALADTLARSTRLQLESPDPDLELEALHAELEAAFRNRSSALLQESLAKTNHRLGRITEVASAKPQDAKEAKALFAATAPEFRRLARRNPGEFVSRFPAELSRFDSVGYPKEYAVALGHYRAMLKQIPLSREGRAGLLYLDFAGTGPDQQPIDSQAILNQIGRLYQSSVEQQLAIARFAAQSGFNEIAIDLWRSALNQSPRSTRSAMNNIKNCRLINLIDALPKNRIVMQMAAARVTRTRDKSNADSLPEMVSLLNCDECESSAKKTECFLIAADALVFAGEDEAALSYFENALDLQPANVPTRMKYIESLRRLRRSRDALTQARIGRQIAPDDNRFDRVIKAMANLEIDEPNSIEIP